MVKFIIKRLLYSVLVLFGVVMLTFLLFNVAAGDPAAAVLGKNPTAQEIEDMRRELGADLPLFLGSTRLTEAFNSYDAATGKIVGNVEYSHIPYNGSADITMERIVFKRNFATPDENIIVKYDFDGRIKIEPALLNDQIPPETEEITFTADPGSKIIQVEFYRPNTSAFNSQFFRTMREICSFTPNAPYISVLDFGRTLVTREPIGRILRRGVGPSLALMLPVFLGELLLGVVLALLAAACKDTIIDRMLLLISIAMMSISYLVVIIFAQWLLAYYWNWFPVWGWGKPEYLLLPVIIGIICGVGGSVRFYRSVFVNELNKEYLRTAAAKGCSPFCIYSKHLLRNALIPIITRAGSVLPFLFTGSLLLEAFFGVPGLGYAGLDALYNSDLQLLKALVIISALLFVAINLLTDIIYAWADPRIRLKN